MKVRLLDLVREERPDLLPLSPVLAEAVAHHVASGRVPPTLLLRRQDPYLLLGPQDRRLPLLAEAVAWASQRVPVFLRVGGGSAVLLDSHCVSFAVALPSRDLTRAEENFRAYTAGVLEALRGLGLPATFGETSGAFCPGPYDIHVGGQKVVGVAQAIRQGYALVSGMILVDQDPAVTTSFLQEFYRRAGGPRPLRADAVTSLARLLGRRISPHEVAQRVQAGYAGIFLLQPGSLLPEEEAFARELLSHRRLG